MSSLFTLLLTLTSIYTSQAPTATATINCTMMVDAGPDVLICDDSQSVMLEGMVSETPIGIQWEPADLLDDPTILTPTATVTETTAFTLSVESFSTENLIFNGDFSQGDTGFTSDYEYGTGGNFGTLSQEGQYAIDDNADDTHNGFANCPDHTGGGLMMVVNASGQPNNVWCQTVTVSPDSDYAFSAWVTSVVSQNPALLRFEINGVQIGDVINPTSAICNWQQFFAVWNSGSATTAEICLSNVNLDPGGNDFALDDIAFNPLCVTTDEVVVEVANLNAEWTSPGIICYNENTIVLDDLLATDATPGGTWTINGTPATELNAADFASPSMLQVEYALENGNCVESNTQNITIALEPEADFSADQTQACIGETITLTYQGNMGLSATYNWDFDGLTATPGTGQGPQEVSTATPGTYTIRLTVEQNGCLSQEVTQTIEFVAPSITSLDVSCVATENSVEFQWPTNPDITAFIPGIISGQTTGVSTSPTSYLVTGLTPGEVVNIQILAFFANGPCSIGTFTASCTAIDCPSVTATLGTIDPICAGTPATIELSITGDAGPFDIVYELDGLANTVMGAGALTDIALNPTQTASFAITSIVNTNAPDCSIDLPAAVAIQVDQPLVAGTAQAIDPICENDGSATFDLNGLLDGADVGGQWLEISASTGSAFDATAGTFDPSLQTPGIYTFVYTQNTGGACPEASATVSIEIGAVPVADAGEDIDLGCDLNTATIGTNNSTQGGTISYQWTTADGGTIPDPSELLNEVEAAGTYILTVLDEATGCAATDEVIITSSNATVEVFATASAASCLASNGGSIQVDSLSGGTGPYLFSLNGQAFTTDSTFLGLTAGAYELIAADINGCQASAMLNVDAPKELIATLSANDGSLEPLVNLGDSLRLRISLTDESATIDTIIWSPAISACANCENPVITPFISSEYAATVITTDGCSATASINIFVAESDRIFIPNAFSPNDDGFNDVFFINAAPEVIAIKEMQIMDRWGNQVFEASDVPANDPFYGWNGSFRGQRMQPGVFVYYVELELAGGISVVKAGELNLLF